MVIRLALVSGPWSSSVPLTVRVAPEFIVTPAAPTVTLGGEFVAGQNTLEELTANEAVVCANTSLLPAA
jgi:hypothetical protein